ncbi:hypothetical protein CY0110_16462 [Crocosphaera chwakensis CCY0110]|uniref:Uncharacterized protein n=1 Tax=Crocosphaera chwakensis CCY0110 TaxID=391612 RepID=A3IHX4_9CHRO|nr:hypothetical protein CY0110_16462 [Crocosphaera chwakensis CCY0110]
MRGQVHRLALQQSDLKISRQLTKK